MNQNDDGDTPSTTKNETLLEIKEKRDDWALQKAESKEATDNSKKEELMLADAMKSVASTSGSKRKMEFVKNLSFKLGGIDSEDTSTSLALVHEL
eukprot:Nk52_evm4s282 gene=Nk52_evmTU4s282